jgi:hypothetical protein
MHFGENQLSRSLIGLSPLPTGHPPGFQPWWVRSSTRSYPRFNLPMGRSLRFGSTACDSDALFRLAFATASPHGLTLPHTVTRRLILQKARGHFTSGSKGRHAPTACRHTVSGTISRPLTGALFTFPSRYLFAIGHQGVFRLRRWSSRIHTGFHGPRATWDTARESQRFRLQGYHPLCRRFPTSSATHAIFYSPPDRQLRLSGPATPNAQRLPAVTRARFGLFPFRSPLLRESRLLSLPVGTEMFHFPTFPPPALCVQAGAMGHYAHSGFPIRKSPDRSLVADSPGLIAGSYVLLRLLVPRHSPCALINLATTDDARVHCAVLKIRAVPASRRPSGPRKHRSCRGRPRGRSLRTQQRARPVRLPGTGVPFRYGGAAPDVLADPGRCPDRITSAPLTSSHTGTAMLFATQSGCGSGRGRPNAGHRASCSLERR